MVRWSGCNGGFESEGEENYLLGGNNYFYIATSTKGVIKYGANERTRYTCDNIAILGGGYGSCLWGKCMAKVQRSGEF